MRLMESRLFRNIIRAFSIASLFCSSLWAGSEYTTVFQMGPCMHSGSGKGSLTGTTSYLVQFSSETRKTTFRSYGIARFELGSGNASLNSGVYNYTRYGGGFQMGANMFFFKLGSFETFFGAGGILGWQLFKLGNAP